MNEQLEFVKQIAARLDAAGIRCMLTRSMAIYAVPRMTRDINLVIESHLERSPKIASLTNFQSCTYYLNPPFVVSFAARFLC